MAIEINTKVSTGETYGKKLGNLILEDAKFFGRPNFSGELDRFKDDRRKFTVLIPNDQADTLRQMGWNVKTDIPTAEDLAQYPDREMISHLRVMVDDISQVVIRVNDQNEELTPATFGVVDRSRILSMDMVIRAWEYDPSEQPGKFSARLETVVCVLVPNILEQKYGRLS